MTKSVTDSASLGPCQEAVYQEARRRREAGLALMELRHGRRY